MTADRGSRPSPGARAEGFLVLEGDPARARACARVLGRARPVAVAGALAEARARCRAARAPWTGVLVAARLARPGAAPERGLDLLAELRASGRLPPALVVAAPADRGALLRAHDLGARCLPGPLEEAQLDLFAARALAVERCPDPGLRAILEAFVGRWRLRPREAELLGLASLGHERGRLPAETGAAPDTVKDRVRALLRRTGARSFEELVRSVRRAYFGGRPVI